MAVKSLEDLQALIWAHELGNLVFNIHRMEMLTEEMGIFEKVVESGYPPEAQEMRSALEKIKEGSQQLLEVFEVYQVKKRDEVADGGDNGSGRVDGVAVGGKGKEVSDESGEDPVA